MLENLIVGLNLYTAHFDESKGFNNVNPGIYVSYRMPVCDPVLGVYRNSERTTSVFAACRISRGIFRLDVGVVGGYASRSINPLIIPSVAIPLQSLGLGKTSLNVGVIPIKDGGVHFSIERGF